MAWGAYEPHSTHAAALEATSEATKRHPGDPAAWLAALVAAERRAIFILLHVLDLSVEHCATICNMTPNAVRVADGRGRRELDNYLGARCEYLDPGNACHCVARLGNALEHAVAGRAGTTTVP